MSGGEETFICEKCNKRLPTISKIIHEVRCNGSIIKEEEKNVPITEARKTYITTTSGTDISNIIVPAQEIKNIKSSSSSSSSSKIEESNLKSSSIIEESNDYIACKVCTYHNSLENITCECCGSNLISGSLNGSMNSSTNSLDNHADNNDNDNDEYWSCSVCTYNNSIDIDKCLMCNTAIPSNLRRPDEIIRDRLINDDDDDDDDDGVCNYSSYESIGESNRIHPLAAAGFGSMAGMMLARMQNRPMSSGMVEGAAFGAMSSMLLNEFISRSNIEDRQSRIDDNFLNNGHDPFSNFREDNLFQAFRELIESSDNSESPPSSETLQSINSLPTHKFNGENDSMSCNICLEPFCNGEDVKTLPCLHLYHSNCIDNWLRRQTNCPVCKTSL